MKPLFADRQQAGAQGVSIQIGRNIESKENPYNGLAVEPGACERSEHVVGSKFELCREQRAAGYSGLRGPNRGRVRAGTLGADSAG